MQLDARSDGPDRKTNIEAPQRIRVDLEGFEFNFFVFYTPLSGFGARRPSLWSLMLSPEPVEGSKHAAQETGGAGRRGFA
jgi:hypothetical protein